MATVAVDMLAALTVLPVLLALLGPRVNALRVRRSVRQPAVAETSGAWYRLANSVMRRPAVYASVIVIVLLALGAPFLRIAWGGTDARTLPATSTVRQVSEAAGAGHHAPARPGQLVGAAAAAPPVRQARDQGGNSGRTNRGSRLTASVIRPGGWWPRPRPARVWRGRVQ